MVRRGLSVLPLLLVQGWLLHQCCARNALGLTDEEVKTIQQVTDLFEKTISYRNNLFETLKPFLNSTFRKRLNKEAKEEVSALLLQPVRLLGDETAFAAWVNNAKKKNPLLPGHEQEILTEITDLLKMALEAKFTPEAERTLKKAEESYISS